MFKNNDMPNPGSPEAVAKGCTCPVIDNGYGKGRGGKGMCFGWWIAEDCPIHGQEQEVKKMTERYNYIDSNKAHEMRCVHAFGEYEFIGDYTSCSGPTCMGWIAELDDTGTPTGRGRCGMVYPIITTCTCAA